MKKIIVIKSPAGFIKSVRENGTTSYFRTNHVANTKVVLTDLEYAQLLTGKFWMLCELVVESGFQLDGYNDNDGIKYQCDRYTVSKPLPTNALMQAQELIDAYLLAGVALDVALTFVDAEHHTALRAQFESAPKKPAK